MSLYKYNLKQSLDIDSKHRRVYIPHDRHGDSIIYLCPRCGRKFCLISQFIKKGDGRWRNGVKQVVEFLPSGKFYHKEERLCGQDNCGAVADMVEHHPCGLLKSIWKVCPTKGCYLKVKCEAYKKESK